MVQERPAGTDVLPGGDPERRRRRVPATAAALVAAGVTGDDAALRLTHEPPVAADDGTVPLPFTLHIVSREEYRVVAVRLTGAGHVRELLDARGVPLRFVLPAAEYGPRGARMPSSAPPLEIVTVLGRADCSPPAPAVDQLVVDVGDQISVDTAARTDDLRLRPLLGC